MSPPLFLFSFSKAKSKVKGRSKPILLRLFSASFTKIFPHKKHHRGKGTLQKGGSTDQLWGQLFLWAWRGLLQRHNGLRQVTQCLDYFSLIDAAKQLHLLLQNKEQKAHGGHTLGLRKRATLICTSMRGVGTSVIHSTRAWPKPPKTLVTINTHSSTSTMGNWGTWKQSDYLWIPQAQKQGKAQPRDQPQCPPHSQALIV